MAAERGWNDEKITDENFVVTLANTNADGRHKVVPGKSDTYW